MSADNILAPVAALALPDSAALTGRAQQQLTFIDSFAVDSQDTFALAGEELASIKRRAKDLETQRTAITGPLNNAMRAVNDLFRGPADLLARAEAALKSKMLGYQSEQERIAAEARRVAEAAAAAERRRLEEEAAERQRAAQAQAEAAAAAARAQADAEAAAAAAAAAGDADAAATAQREADAQAQAAAMAQAATARAQAEAHAAATTAQIVTAPVLAVAPPKAAGISTSKKVDFELVDLAKLVQHIATGTDAPLAHPELLGLLGAGDSVRLRAYVRGLGTACALPGVRVFESKVMSARAAA